MKTDLQKRKHNILLSKICSYLFLLLTVANYILDNHYNINENALINRNLNEEESQRLLKEGFLPEADEGGWMKLEGTGLIALNDQNDLLLNNGKRESKLYRETLAALTPEGNLLTLYSSEKRGNRYKLWNGTELSTYLGISNIIFKISAPLSGILFLLYIVFLFRRLIYRIRFGKLKKQINENMSQEAETDVLPVKNAPVESPPKKKQPDKNDINSPDPDVRKKAVYNIEDQEVLKKLGVSDLDEDVRIATINRISDRDFKENIAKTDISPHVRLAAIKALNDYQFTFSRIKEDPDSSLQLKAVKFCKENTLLTDLYNTHPGSKIRQAAFQKIKPDVNNARWIYEETNDRYIKTRALKHIHDETFFEKILTETDDYDTCLITGSGISEEKLTALFPRIQNREAQKELLGKISSTEFKTSLISPDIPVDLLEGIVRSIPEEEQPVLLTEEKARMIYETIEDEELKKQVFKLIKDEAYLEKTLHESRDYVICLDAGSRIPEERLLKLVSGIRNQNARQDLLKKNISAELKLSLLSQSLTEELQKEVLSSFPEEYLFTILTESTLPENTRTDAIKLIYKKDLIWKGINDTRLNKSLQKQFEKKVTKPMQIEWIKSEKIPRKEREKLLKNLPDDDLYSVLGSELDEEVIKRIEAFSPYGWFECSHYSPGMKYASCSDNACPCPGTSYPKGEGYLFISRLCAHFRIDYPGEMEIQRYANKNYGRGMLAPPSEAFNAIFLCENAAKKRGLDLETAARDAKIWWYTEKAPCRSTPIIKRFSKEEDPNYTVNMNPIMFKAMFGNPPE